MTDPADLGDECSLDEFQAEQALGAMVARVVDQLTFAGPGAVAVTGFEVDGTRYEIRVTVKPHD